MKHEGFTPGPWTARQDGDDWEVVHIRTNAYYGERITEDRVFSIRTGVIPNPADAALIAAAPSLLAENERLRGLLRDIRTSPAVEVEAFHRAIDAALAGGRGGE